MKKNVIAIILCMFVFVSCSSNAYINNSSDVANIKVNNDVFDATIDESIDILNNDIKDEELDLIPLDYEVIDYNDRTIYKCKINEKLMIQFTSYLDEGDKIVRIGTICLKSYENTDKDIQYEATKKEVDNAEKYYEIICNNVEPSFNSSRFSKEISKGTGEFELNGLLFIVNNPSVTDGNRSEDIYQYEVFSSQSLFEKYEEEFFDEDSIFFT